MRFTIQSRHQALKPLGRADLESCVSNSIVGLLDGDGLDEIYHVIELVLLGFDP